MRPGLHPAKPFLEGVVKIGDNVKPVYWSKYKQGDKRRGVETDMRQSFLQNSRPKTAFKSGHKMGPLSKEFFKTVNCWEKCTR